MGDHPIHHIPIPPPPPIQTSNLSILYYSLVIVGTAAIVLVLYNFIILRCCASVSEQWSSQAMSLNPEPPMSRSSRNMYKNCVYSFKYKKGGGEDSQHECAVCLSVFEEGEQLSQLPNCKHCFHADCIDMWLYSHMDCPLCRTSVEPPRHAATEHSHEGFWGPAQSSLL